MRSGGVRDSRTTRAWTQARRENPSGCPDVYVPGTTILALNCETTSSLKEEATGSVVR